MRILVFSRAHSQYTWMSTFPHVRGQGLARSLRRLGEDAEFRALPVAGDYEVAICSDYLGDATWMDKLERRMVGMTARRMFCMADGTTSGSHLAAPMAEWFARRGGVFCHLRERPLAPYEHYIGLGVEVPAIADAAVVRRAVFFDFPRSQRVNAAAAFDPSRLEAVRRAHPDFRMLGSGPADTPIRNLFDEWIAYGVPHDEYVPIFTRCVAFVPGGNESLGLAVAEAQVAGAAIVTRPGLVRAEMLVPSAALVDEDLVRGIGRAIRSDSVQIAREAAERFSPTAMAKRVMAVIRAVG